MAGVCQCGFSFSRAIIERTHKLESFAVIPDRKYKKLLKVERKYRKTKKNKHFNRAAQMLASMYICPECGTHVLTMPKAYDYETRYLHVDRGEPSLELVEEGTPTQPPG